MTSVEKSQRKPVTYLSVTHSDKITLVSLQPHRGISVWSSIIYMPKCLAAAFEIMCSEANSTRENVVVKVS